MAAQVAVAPRADGLRSLVSTASSAEPSRLPRTLTRVDLVLLGVGTVIGSGIFLVPALVLREGDGALGMAACVWVGAGLLSWFGALTYGELGAMKPDAGGLYVYIRDAFGPLVAFLYGWGLFFVVGSGSVATLMVAFVTYFRELYPIGDVASRAVMITMIAAIGAVNVRGARASADAQNWLTVAKAIVIVALSIAFISGGNGFVATTGRWWPAHGWRDVTSAGIAIVGALWAFEGWQYVTFSRYTISLRRGTCRCGAAGCSSRASAARTISRWRRCRTSRCPAMSPRAVGTSPETSSIRPWHWSRAAALPSRPNQASASKSTLILSPDRQRHWIATPAPVSSYESTPRSAESL